MMWFEELKTILETLALLILFILIVSFGGNILFTFLIPYGVYALLFGDYDWSQTFRKSI